jgi:hypothetical protein
VEIFDLPRGNLISAERQHYSGHISGSGRVAKLRFPDFLHRKLCQLCNSEVLYWNEVF